MSKRDYEVGYGKPPKAGQFKKGESGNQNGRPKGRKSTGQAIEEMLNQKITIKKMAGP